MRRRRRVFIPALLLAVALSCYASASVAASVTIGRETTDAYGLTCTSTGNIWAQGGPDASSYEVPSGGGTITSWYFGGEETSGFPSGGQVALVVLRPTAMPGTFSIAAESPLENLSFSAPVSVTGTSIPVQGGDQIGFYIGPVSNNGVATGCFSENNTLTDTANVAAFFGALPAIGTDESPSDTYQGVNYGVGFIMNLGATITPPGATLPAVQLSTNPAAPGASDNGYFNKADAVKVDLSASGPASISSESCTDNGKAVTLQDVSGTNPLTADFSPSGDGAHSISCTATDSNSNTSNAATLSIKIDATPPTLNVSSQTLDATGPSGVVDDYPNVSASDNINNPQPFSCKPPAGSTLPIGNTAVQCSATDEAGNTTTNSFNVHVKGVTEQLADLVSATKAAQMPALDRQILLGDLEGATFPVTRCFSLTLYRQVLAQSLPGSIPAASTLSADAARIQAVNGCRS